MNEKEEIPHIGLSVADIFTDEELSKIQDEVKHGSLRIATKKIPSTGFYASLEWAIPAALTVYFFKSYFDGFLKEMGKDHYVILKQWLKKTAVEMRKVKFTFVRAEKSVDKSDSNPQSHSFSIHSPTDHGKLIKFLFDDRLSDEQWKTAIDDALILIEDHFSDIENDEISLAIKKYPNDNIIYARVNMDNLEWEFLDIRKSLFEKKAN